MYDQGLPTKEALLAELVQAQAELDDVTEMRLFTLGQTGVHLGAGRMNTLQASWDRDEARLRQRIDEIEGLLERAS